MPDIVKTGVVNGSDMLFEIAEKCVGHCTSHDVTYSAEYKEVATKAAKTVTSLTTGYYANKILSKLSASVNFNGLRVYDESEGGFKSLLAAWKSGQPVNCKLFERGGDATPYIVANFVITQLQESNPAGDDATYSGTLELTGAPTTLDASKLTGETLTA